MLQQLIDLSPDLQKLRNEGYEMQYSGGYLIIHHIPYVNPKKEIHFGSLVTSLTLNGNRTFKPDTHVIHFIGEHPCDKYGNIITAIQHSTGNQQLYTGLIANHSFSNKPPDGYRDYYHKISRYADMISAPAKSINKDVTACTFKLINYEDEQDVFNYYDSNSSRANIQMINEKFKNQEIAIIGIGGTGSYILDLVAKTPVKKIHLFDGDIFLQHNSFRSPGAASKEFFREAGTNKVDYFADVYSNMHRGIVRHSYYLTEDNLGELDRCSYVFICVDNNRVRKMIMKYLIGKGISFIDVGLGINTVDDTLIGTLRITSATAEKNDHLHLRISEQDDDNNEYATNIQIADLNSLNASLAVIKWKKLSKFYQDIEMEHNSNYCINVSKIINNDSTT